MAVTQDEERASKISDHLAARLEMMVGQFKDKAIRAQGLSCTSFQTQNFYKKQKDGTIKMCRYLVSPQHKGDDILTADGIRIDRISGAQTYASILSGTKTKKPIDRLLTELKKRITKDLRDAWCETEEQAMVTSADTLKKPMKLYKWEKQKKKITYPCYAQPKHDGIRAIYDNGKFYSRSGKVVLLPHLTDALEEFGAVSLDGEIAYDDFTVPLPEVIEGISRQDKNLKYHVFDNIHKYDPDKFAPDFEERFVSKVNGWFSQDGLATLPGIRICATHEFDSEEEIDAYYEEATQSGMEGIVVRNADSPYEYGRRTMFTLKYKLEYEEVFKVEGYQPVAHPEGNLIQFVCTFNGHQFEVVPAWTHNHRRECLRYFDGEGRTPGVTIMMGNLPPMLIEYRGITPAGKPYHAVGKTKWMEYKKGLDKWLI